MSMDKSEIIKMVLELYSARKEAKEYLDFYAEPNEGQKLEEYKHIIREEFYPSRNREPKTRFSVCRKALSDFKKLKPSEDSIAELMVFYMENACQFTYDYGDMWEQFYDSVESNFDKTLRHIVLYDLWDKYDSRIKQCLRWASEYTQMGKPKKKHKKAKQLPLSKEEQIYQAARDLAAEIGISYSEALGFTLGIKDVTYGWEDDYTEEEFQALIDHAVGDTDYEHTLY